VAVAAEASPNSAINFAVNIRDKFPAVCAMNFRLHCGTEVAGDDSDAVIGWAGGRRTSQSRIAAAAAGG